MWLVPESVIACGLYDKTMFSKRRGRNRSCEVRKRIGAIKREILSLLALNLTD